MALQAAYLEAATPQRAALHELLAWVSWQMFLVLQASPEPEPNCNDNNMYLLMWRRAAKDTVRILAALQAAYPEAITPQQAALHELLGPINERITSRAISLLAEGDVEALGNRRMEKSPSVSPSNDEIFIADGNMTRSGVGTLGAPMHMCHRPACAYADCTGDRF